MVLVLTYSEGAHWIFEGHVKHIQEGDLYRVSVGIIKNVSKKCPAPLLRRKKGMFFHELSAYQDHRDKNLNSLYTDDSYD